MKIALLMGSFNPIHKGHTSIAEYVLERGIADRVWLVVSPHNPLKSPEQLAPFEDRISMVRIATRHNDRLVPCDIEKDLPTPSYTVHTILYLKESYPQHDFFVLAGSDIATQLHLWYKVEQLRKMVQFLIYPRAEAEAYCTPEMTDAPRYNIDATSIREAYSKGAIKVSNIDSAVEYYIKNRGLYLMKTVQFYTMEIEHQPHVVVNYLERGKLHYKYGDHAKALNDFNKVLELDSSHVEARNMKTMVESIFNFRNFDIYNP